MIKYLSHANVTSTTSLLLQLKEDNTRHDSPINNSRGIETLEYSRKCPKNPCYDWVITDHWGILYYFFQPRAFGKTSPSFGWSMGGFDSPSLNEDFLDCFFQTVVISLADRDSSRISLFAFSESSSGAYSLSRLRRNFAEPKVCPQFIEGHRWPPRSLFQRHFWVACASRLTEEVRIHWNVNSMFWAVFGLELTGWVSIR